MKFEKYQHIEKLGTATTKGILNGTVHILPKLDGTNTSVYLNDNGEVEVASRNRVLTFEHDNVGDYKYVMSQNKFKDYLSKFPRHRLFGEWLVPHTIKNYVDSAWRKLYIFDVIDEDVYGNESYLTYDEYSPLLERFGIEYVLRLCFHSYPTDEDISKLQNECTFLMQVGKFDEGIVIKNYEFVNKFGNIVWAKIVRPAFKTTIKILGRHLIHLYHRRNVQYPAQV